MFLFFFFFEPFNVDNLALKQKANVSMFLGIITFAILGLYIIVLPAYFKNFFSNKKWFVYTEILWDLWLMINVAVGYYLYFEYNQEHLLTLSIIDSLKIIALAALVISILIVLNYQRMLKINLKNAVELNQKIQKQEKDDRPFYFESEYRKDSISLNIEDVVLLKSAGNYVEIFYFDNNIIKRHLIRSSLKKIEEQLQEKKTMYRCHRSYIINISYISNAEADSLGLKLNMKNLNFSIPVSKNYVEKLKKIL